MIRFPGQTAWSAHYFGSSEFAGNLALSFGCAANCLRIYLHVPGHKKIKKTITVVVSPGGPCRPSAKCHACFLCHVRKGAVVIIVEKPILAVVRHEDIGPTIVIEVADDRSEAPPIIRNACLRSYVGKGSVVIIMKERSVRRSRLPTERFCGRSIHQIDIKPSVAVIIQ